LQSTNLFRSNPVGKPCSCDTLFQGFKWHELRLLRSRDLSKTPSVYVLRVTEKSEDLSYVSRKILELVENTEWNELIRYVESRLARLDRIGECPVIYIGSTGARRSGLRSRLMDLAGRRHTAFFPVFTILVAHWKIDFGFVTCSTVEEARRLEKDIKQRYKEIHGGLPALVNR